MISSRRILTGLGMKIDHQIAWNININIIVTAKGNISTTEPPIAFNRLHEKLHIHVDFQGDWSNIVGV